MKKKYYYKLGSCTETGRMLQDLMVEGNKAVQEAAALAKELGAVRFSPNMAAAMGGIGSLFFTSPQSARAYVKLGRVNGLYEYMPNVHRHSGYSIACKIARLPLVKASRVAELLCIPKEKEELPAWFRRDGEFLFCAGYELNATGIEEIGKEEYEKAINNIRLCK